MEEDTNRLEIRILRLEDKLLKGEARRPTFFSVLEKLFLPAAVAAVGLGVSLAGHQVAKGQLALAEAQEKRVTVEAQTDIHLKALETFYQYISSSEPEKQKTALYLLTAMDPDVGQRLARAVAVNPTVSLEMRQVADKVSRSIALVGPLINYRIVIYFSEAQAQQKERAEKLLKSLVDYAPLVSVSTRGATDTQLKNWVYPKGNEIRYDPLYENEAAEQLQTLLRTVLPKKTFTLLPTSTERRRTENVLSIFLVD